jgi:hypothetical protein
MKFGRSFALRSADPTRAAGPDSWCRAGAAGIDQPSVRIVVGEQRGAEPRPRAFGIGLADHEGRAQTQQFCCFHEPGEVPSGLDYGLILDSLSKMFAGGNHGLDDVKGRAR